MTTAAPRAPAVPLSPPPATRPRDLDRWLPFVLAVIAYVPLLLTHRGMVGADTKQYLYLDPGRMLSQARSMWDPSVGTGTVTHQNIGYLLPMGPWYWFFHALHVPVWVAQRLWTGTLLFVAGLGVRSLCRTIGWAGAGRAAVGAGAGPGAGASFGGGTPPAATLAGAGITVASLSYMLTPYVLEYVARISAILMPWAALPWMVALVMRALRTASWKHPALFALTVALCGGVNATSLIFAGIAPVLWFPFAIWVYREVTPRSALATLGRIGFLTVLTNVWWISGLWVQAGYGLDVLRYTETVQTVAQTGFAIEALRGLGNWYFYGRDAIGPWLAPATEYTQQVWHLALSYLVPFTAFVGGVVTRWRSKLYFVTLIAVGTALVVGVHPYSHPTPIGGLFKAFASSSSAGLALRSVGRAAPLVALGTAVLLGALAESVHPRFTAIAAGGLSLLVLLNMAPLFTGQFVDDNLQRPNTIPSYWPQAAAYMGSLGPATRVLELPGADFSHYRWGTTLDPVTPGLMTRPFVGRELIPYGSPASADLLRALDERLQEGVFEPQELAPIARLLGAGTVDLRSDLQYERFLTPRPVPTWSQFSPPPPGLSTPKTFGGAVPLNTTQVPLVDEIALETPAGAVGPPAVAVFGVDGTPAIVHAQPTSAPTVVAGDGEGLVDMAAAGLLDGGAGNGPVLYAAGLDATQFNAAMAQGADLVLTDTNRKQAQRWGTVRYTLGYTEQAGEHPLVTDPTDARLPVFPGAGDDAYTVAQERGIASIRATEYGNPVSYDPGVRPDQAIDGDLTTAWEAGAFSDPTGARLEIDLLHPVTTNFINLVQPLTGANERYITQATVTFDGGSPLKVDMQQTSRTPVGQTITFPTRTFSRLDITVDNINFGRRADYSGGSGVGIAEVRIPGVTMHELVRLPTDLLASAGATSAQHNLSIVMTRLRANPQEAYVTDPELNISRVFTLPTARSFSLAGTARLAPTASDEAVDYNLGRVGGVTVRSSNHLTGRVDESGYSAVDGDPATAWNTDFAPQAGSWIEVRSPQPVTVDHLDMTVVADGRHSVPTAVQFNVDGKPGEVLHLPPITDRTAPNATVTVRLPVQRVTGSDFRFTVLNERAVQTINYFSKVGQDLPIGIAELGIPGVAQPLPTAPLPSACRDDLISIDGKPVRVHVDGTAEQARALSPLTLTPCDGQVALGPGEHVIETAVGRDMGMSVDRLVLSSTVGGARPSAGSSAGPGAASDGSSAGPGAASPGSPGSPGSPAAGRAPVLRVTHQSASSVTVATTTAPGQSPFWLVFGQSQDTGWRATVHGRSLGKPVVVNGFANGWLVNPPAGGGPLTVVLTFTPQRVVNVALVISALGILLCLGLAFSRTRAAAPSSAVDLPVAPTLASPLSPSRWRPAPHVAAATVVATGVVGAIVIAPAVGIGLAVAAAVAIWRPTWRAVLGAGSLLLLGGSILYVLQLQVRYRFPTKIEWPEHFDKVALIPWAAVGLLLLDAVFELIGHVRDRPPRDRP
ncbi:MAG TPA: alpha-(1-_3)-arabinofuranosyltransferase family protein [Acidimicrobiales bacterium]|nr:alpha-(1->3)-arabinofuranosyltransferase family protein [Acidimicrobiales bacterium]